MAELQLSASGEVATVQIRPSDHPDLEPFVVAAVKQWRFEPLPEASEMSGKFVVVVNIDVK